MASPVGRGRSALSHPSTEASSSGGRRCTLELTLVAAAEQKKQPLQCFDTCTDTQPRSLRTPRRPRSFSSLFLSPMLYDGDFECGEQRPPRPAPIKTPGRQRSARSRPADRRSRGRAPYVRLPPTDSPLTSFLLLFSSSPQPLLGKYARARFGHLSARNLGFSAVLF